MWACSLEIHLYPCLKRMKSGQQGEGDDSTPLLCSWEIPAGALHPALVPLEQEKQGHIEAGPEEEHKNH